MSDQHIMRSICLVRSSAGSGTGLLVNLAEGNNLILTPYHVVSKSKPSDITFTFPSGDRTRGHDTYAYDKDVDFALIQLASIPSSIIPVALRQTPPPIEGLNFVVYHHPGGAQEIHASYAVVRSKGTTHIAWGPDDATIGGSSGGVCVGPDGQVFAIHQGKFSQHGQNSAVLVNAILRHIRGGRPASPTPGSSAAPIPSESDAPRGQAVFNQNFSGAQIDSINNAQTITISKNPK